MTAVQFSKQGSPVAFDKALGLCFGWFCFSKQRGEPYVDLHGDHFPDDELVKAVDELMAKPASEREINVEHAGAARGSIATAQALTEDVAKALKIDTGGTYGVIGSFRPDAALLKSILAGEAFCLSIEGRALDVEQVAKSAADAAATEHKRTMRKVELTKLAVVKAGAHEGAAVALVKSANVADAIRKLHIAKATPGLTTPEAGHAHMIYDTDEAAGSTSCEPMSGQPDGGWHSHPWVRNEDGSLSIGESLGHSHTLAGATGTSTETDIMSTETLAKTQADLTAATADLKKARSLLDAALSLTPEQTAFAKSLPADRREAFLALPEAERIAKATPIYKSAAGDVFYPGEERLASFAKRADEADAREAAVAFEKRATDELGSLRGTPADKALVLKAIAGKPLTADEQAKALEVVKAASTGLSTIYTAPGFNKREEPVDGPQGELDKIAADLHKANPGWSIAKAKDAALDTPRGRQLYAAIEAAKRAPAHA